MLATLFLRLGLRFLAPYALPVVLSLLISVGSFSASWLGLLSGKDALIWSMIVSLALMVTQVNSFLKQIALLAAIVFIGYWFGRVDEQELLQVKITAAEDAVRQKYNDAANLEIQRQEAIALEAKMEAQRLKTLRLEEIEGLRDELQKIRTQADAEEADRISAGEPQEQCLAASDVKLLNTLRVRTPTTN